MDATATPIPLPPSPSSLCKSCQAHSLAPHSPTMIHIHQHIHCVAHCCHVHTTLPQSELDISREQSPQQGLQTGSCIQIPYTCLNYAIPYIQHNGLLQPKTTVSVTSLGYIHSPSSSPCPYQHQRPSSPTNNVITTSDASAPPPSQSDSTSIHMEATPSGGSTQHDIPQRGEEEISTDGQDPNQNVKVEAFSGCNESNTGCQAIRKTVPEITSEGMANALAEQEKQQQRKEQYHKIYETRKRHALEKNFAAFEAVQHRYILSCGQPVLTIVSNSKETCVIPQDDDETTDYDSDEDGENGREEEDEEEISQRYSEFVQAIGYTEPLDNVAHATVMNYLNTYNLNRLENARVRQFELRIVRSNIAEKILLSIKSQKKESTTRTRMWSRQTWNQEMNKAIRHYKKSDSYWKDRMSVLEERLNRSWNENVARAKQDLQKHHLDV